MVFAPLDAGMYGIYLSKHGVVMATLMAQDILSTGHDPKQVLADVHNLLTDVDQIMSEGKSNDPDWENLRVEWCLTSSYLLRRLQEAERILNQSDLCMKIPALAILCNMFIFLNSRRTTLELNNISIPEAVM